MATSPVADFPDCPGCGYPLLSTPCAECHDKKQEAQLHRDHLARSWGGLRALRDFSLARLRKNPVNHEAVKAVQEFDPGTQNLYLFGPTGIGKTHMAVAAARRHIKDQYPPTIVWKAYDIARQVRAADGAQAEIDFISGLSRQKILIIDDLGVEKRTGFMDTTLYEIIEARDMSGRGGLIITSNISLGGLDKLLGSTRLSSRISRLSIILDLSAEKDHRIPA